VARSEEEPAPRAIEERIRRAGEGDRKAAESVLSEILPRVRNLVRYLVRGDSEVDDLAQHALIAIYRGLASYRGEGRFESWADRITVRETLSRRKRRHQEEKRLAPADLSLVASEGTAPDEYLSRREVARWLDQIPQEQREVMILHHAVGMSLQEISEESSVSTETLKSRLRLAKAKLRELARAQEGRR
jgi:RNA polymerase sigma-70 factor, ECF subfamily